MYEIPEEEQDRLIDELGEATTLKDLEDIRIMFEDEFDLE